MHQQVCPHAVFMQVLRSDNYESAAQLLICVNQTTFKRGFVHSLEQKTKASVRVTA